MTTTTTFLGIPVEGDITRGDKRAEQRPIEELQPLLAAVLADEFVTEFGWTQYTPYFNDGEPCIFGVNTPWVRTTEDSDASASYELDVDSSHPTLGNRVYREGRFYDIDRSPERTATYERCKAFAAAIEGGAFEDVFLEAFGDHAEVTVRRDGITVEFYSHD